jgi:hypothetical protein
MTNVEGLSGLDQVTVVTKQSLNASNPLRIVWANALVPSGIVEQELGLDDEEGAHSELQ